MSQPKPKLLISILPPITRLRNNISLELEMEFVMLISYMRVAPKSVQIIFDLLIAYLAMEKHKDDEIVQKVTNKVKAAKHSIQKQLSSNEQILQTKVLEMIGLHQLKQKLTLPDFQEELSKFNNHWEAIRLKNPTSLYSKCIKMNLIRPQYHITEAIAKYQGQSDIGNRFQKDQRLSSFFYKQPRFIDKIAELVHFRKNNLHKGDIALLQYTGNFIIGKRAYCIAKDTQFQIWQKDSEKHPYPFVDQQKQVEAKYNRAHQDSSQDQSETNEQNESEGSLSMSSLQQMKQKQSKCQFSMRRSFRFLGHSKKITCASFSQDQYYIVTGSADKTVKLWCLRLKILLATYRSHSKTVWDVHFNPSGLYFLSGGADGLMILWRTDTPKPQRMFVHKGDIYKVHFANNPTFAVSGGQDCCLKVWNLITSHLVSNIPTNLPVINFNLGHSGAYILIAESDGRVSLRNIKNGIFISTFYFFFKGKDQTTDEKNIIHDLCFSEDEKTIACITSKHILLYSMNTLQLSKKSLNQSIQLQTMLNDQNPQEQKITYPSMVLMSYSTLRFTYCRFRNCNTLVIGGTKSHS